MYVPADLVAAATTDYAMARTETLPYSLHSPTALAGRLIDLIYG